MFLLNRPANMLIAGGFLFGVDRYFKWQAIHAWVKPKLIGGWFGWQPFFNPGVAFGIPVPGVIIVILSFVIISLIFYHLFFARGDRRYEIRDIGLLLILAGALSNLIDRIAYGYTVDYFRIYTSMINLADVMIVIGFLLYLLVHNRKVDKVA